MQLSTSAVGDVARHVNPDANRVRLFKHSLRGMECNPRLHAALFRGSRNGAGLLGHSSGGPELAGRDNLARAARDAGG